MSGYLLDNREREAGGRFGALSALFDPVTALRLDAVGVAEGWRCWEIGAGGPSVPRMLASRVGPTGSVLATDIDTGWLSGGVPEGVRVLRHDVAADDPPGGGFDLIHARLVLVHVPERDAVLPRLVEALRPGGRLLVEDFDCATPPLACLAPDTPEQRLSDRVRETFLELLAARGADLRYGRRLPGLLRAAGLCDVGVDAYFANSLPALAELELANLRQVRAGMLAAGRTEAELDAHLAAVAGRRVDPSTPPLIGVWGRRPG